MPSKNKNKFLICAREIYKAEQDPCYFRVQIVLEKADNIK